MKRHNPSPRGRLPARPPADSSARGGRGGAEPPPASPPGDARPRGGRPAGHRRVPHTADLRIEAWGPTRERCLAEAVRGLVSSFADTAGVRPRRTVAVELPPGPAEDALVTVLEEVIYRLEVDGEITLDAEVAEPPGGGPVARLTVGDAAEATGVGAAPKAVSLHGLRFDRDAEGWSCTVTIDV
nr:archease [Thermomonospora catenispora]